MRISTRVNLFLGFLVVVSLMMLAVPSLVFASEEDRPRRQSPPEVNINSGNTRTIDRSQDITNDSDASAESAAAAQAAAEAAGGDGGGGGSSTVNTETRSSSIVLTGAQDSADCFTKVGVGADGFGIFWSRSDSFCKKVRLIARKIDEGNYAAAARLECTLKEWEEVYGHRNIKDPGYKQCLEDLMPAPEPTGVSLTHDEYHALTMAQVSQEEYQEQSELVEYRIAQQSNLIESLQQETAADDLEISRLKARAAELEQEQQARKAVDTQQMTEFQALYEKRVAQEIEEPAQIEEPPNE